MKNNKYKLHDFGQKILKWGGGANKQDFCYLQLGTPDEILHSYASKNGNKNFQYLPDLKSCNSYT